MSQNTKEEKGNSKPPNNPLGLSFKELWPILLGVTIGLIAMTPEELYRLFLSIVSVVQVFI